MCVSICYVGRFVPDSVSDGHSAETHIDEHRHVSVPKVMDPDAPNAGDRTASIHFVMEIRLRHPLENTSMAINLENLFNVVSDLLAQEPRYGDRPVRHLRLGRSDDGLALANR